MPGANLYKWICRPDPCRVSLLTGDTPRVIEIRGTTTLVGLLGWPTSHSLSPPMQNAGFAALGLDWAYVPLPTPPELLADAVRGLAATGFAGANVTIPHKQSVIEHCDELDPIATAPPPTVTRSRARSTRLGAVRSSSVPAGALVPSSRRSSEPGRRSRYRAGGYRAGRRRRPASTSS
jgi:hypothetical protein